MESVAVAEATQGGAATPVAGRVNPWIRWPLRVVITVHALAAFFQAILAGRFLSGDYDMLEVHFINSQVVGGSAIAQLVAAILYWRPGGGHRWPAVVGFALLAIEPVQIAAGIERSIGLHIPLGVAIIAASALFTLWAWRPAFGRLRPGKVQARR